MPEHVMPRSRKPQDPFLRSMAARVVGRLSVAASDREVIRALRDCIRVKDRRGRDGRRDRHYFFRVGLHLHQANRAMFDLVKFGGMR